MTEEQKEARRAYRRKWAKDHPEKVAEYQSRFWQKKADEMKAEAQK